MRTGTLQQWKKHGGVRLRPVNFVAGNEPDEHMRRTSGDHDRFLPPKGRFSLVEPQCFGKRLQVPDVANMARHGLSQGDSGPPIFPSDRNWKKLFPQLLNK